ncbi:hypothetical protein CYMTET_40720 [Cymbomonas tetramitiformis]|uniref:Uncharacterized protein n=1 Tax=Cymbomonas tetramitiformis TaxID=36881 RepID=A0AAE0C8W1_9CHLO|nr:hypothetical protein CYMTET_40720 [Cymbomonas tetramitiformis]
MSSTPYATPPVLPRRLLTHPPGARKRQLKFGALNGTPTPADAPDTSDLSVCNNLAWELLRKPAEFDALLSVIKGKCVEPGESAKTWKFTSSEKNSRLLLDILVEQLDSRLTLVHPKMALMFDLQNHGLEVPKKANLLLLELLQSLCAGDALRVLRKADRLFPGDGKIALVHLVRHVVPDHEEFSAADFLFAGDRVDLRAGQDPADYIDVFQTSLDTVESDLGPGCTVTISEKARIALFLRRICPVFYKAGSL